MVTREYFLKRVVVSNYESCPIEKNDDLGGVRGTDVTQKKKGVCAWETAGGGAADDERAGAAARTAEIPCQHKRQKPRKRTITFATCHRPPTVVKGAVKPRHESDKLA